MNEHCLVMHFYGKIVNSRTSAHDVYRSGIRIIVIDFNHDIRSEIRHIFDFIDYPRVINIL